ncbi:COG4648 family protein [Cognatilysobacter tabacisoli]|uniref:ketosynthase n=1 Tax=Cognatilysobacter tabacisoli TaxID=2315424 RepID=UPI000E6B240A
MILLLRIALAAAYPLLAHWASHRGDGASASVALLDLVLVVLLLALARGRPAAWLALAGGAAALWALAPTGVPQLLLLAPPVLFTALVAWWFWRSLRSPRGALITRIVCALEAMPADRLAPDLLRYTRRLTAAWAGLLALVSLANATLALLAVPGGVLARLGHPPGVLAIAQTQWSLWANLVNYGVVALFFVGEFAFRHRRFPQRSYRGFPDFVRQLARLGPAFWRDFLRG